VDIIAAPGSKAFGGRMLPHYKPACSFPSRAFRKIWFQFYSLRAAINANVVLNFGRIDYLAGLLKTRIPIVCRFGKPVEQREVDWSFSRRRSHMEIVGVSRFQFCALRQAKPAHIIYNATDIDKFVFSPFPSRTPYLAFLGRLTSKKGIDTAINVATRAGLQLKIAGVIPNESEEREFFDSVVAPAIGSNVQYIGPIDDTAKPAFLGGAVAMLAPIRWEEPCANVIAESLACGTPVIGSRCASLPEVIDDARNGILCDNEDQMVEAISQIPAINRADCRAAAEARFSAPVMLRKYLEVMKIAIDDGKCISRER